MDLADDHKVVLAALSADLISTFGASLEDLGSVVVAWDVGGTNSRFGFQETGGDSRLVQARFIVKSSRTLLAIMEAVEALLFDTLRLPAVHGAAVSITGGVLEGVSVPIIANFDSADGGSSLHKTELPMRLLPHSRTALINDIVGTVEGILALSRTDSMASRFEILWEPNGADLPEVTPPSLDRFNHCLCNVGTGLGNLGMLRRASLRTPKPPGHDDFVIVPLEFGHTTVCDLPPDLQPFAESAAKALREAEKPCEWDDLVSGRGLVHAYRWCLSVETSVTADGSESKLPEDADAGAIAKSWREDPIAEKAMLIHFSLLMLFASNLVIITQAEGVILAGANQASNVEFVRAHKDELRAVFESHSMERHKWLSKCRFWTQIPVVDEDAVELNMRGVLGVAMDQTASPSEAL